MYQLVENYMEQLGKGQIKCVAQELRVRIAQVEQDKKKLACLTPKPDGYMKRISNFSQARQKEAAQRYYAPLR